MQQLLIFEYKGFPNHVFLLYHSLYWPKQAPRGWYHLLRLLLITSALLVTNLMSHCLFTTGSTHDIFCYMSMTSSSLLYLSLSCIKSLLVYQLRTRVLYKHVIFLSQQKYAVEILDAVNMLHCKLARTPTDTLTKLHDTRLPVTSYLLSQPSHHITISCIYSSRSHLYYSSNLLFYAWSKGAS